VAECRSVELVGLSVACGEKERGKKAHSDNMVIFHESWLVASEETEHSENESHYGAGHREQSRYAHCGRCI
jgi:hypothetical protein